MSIYLHLVPVVAQMFHFVSVVATPAALPLTLTELSANKRKRFVVTK